jgi:hypothetical protein
VWTTASALAEFFRALTPGVTDAARAGALGREVAFGRHRRARDDHADLGPFSA